MAPHLYIYGLTNHRDEATIARFLDLYVDRDASEHRHAQGLAAFGRLPPRDEAAFRALADDPLTMLFFSREREVSP